MAPAPLHRVAIRPDLSQVIWTKVHGAGCTGNLFEGRIERRKSGGGNRGFPKYQENPSEFFPLSHEGACFGTVSNPKRSNLRH